MFYVHTFHSNGQHRLGSFSTMVIPDLKTIRAINRRVYFSACLDTRLGYEIEEVSTSNPYAPGKIVYRSPLARQLFGAIL